MGRRTAVAMVLAACAAACAAGCGDDRDRGEGVPPSSISDSTILADTAKRDMTVPDDPGSRS